MTSKDTNPKDAIGTAKWRQFFVVPRQVLWEVGVGMLEGALKYGRHNYRGAGVRASVYCDAALGHIEQFIEGEDIDRDSGLSHVTKAICSLVVLRDAMMNDFWTDDRPPKIKDLDGLRDRLQELVAENFDRHADKSPHHYSHEEDGAPYYDADGTVWHGVNVDDAERAVMRSDAFQELVEVEREKQRARARPWSDYAGRSLDQTIGLGYWNTSDEDFDDGDILRESGITTDQEVRIALTIPFTADDIDMEVLLADSALHLHGIEHTPTAVVYDLHTKPDPNEVAPPRVFALNELRVGRTYRLVETWNGRVVQNGGEWTIKSILRDGRPAGVKPHWSASHKGCPLSRGTWEEIPLAVPEETAKSWIYEQELRDQDTELEQIIRQFEHAQSSASVTPPILGLSSHALALLDDWRIAAGHDPFPANTPQTARALALRQWAIMRGIISHEAK